MVRGIIFFSRLSLSNKFVLAILMVSMSSLAVAIISFGWYDLQEIKKSTEIGLQTHAKILAQNSTAAIYFGDKEAVDEFIRSLSAERNLLKVEVYRKVAKQQQLFAAFTTDNNVTRHLFGFFSGAISHNQKVELNGSEIGSVLIEINKEILVERFNKYLFYSFSLLMVALVLSLFLSHFFHKRLINPIMELADSCEKVKNENNYSLRIRYEGRDEVGQLSELFNQMLEQIENRDAILEQQVGKRTQELVVAQSKAEAANNAKSAFIANMSHEIRTPLNSILGFSYLAIQSEEQSKQRDYLNHIYSSSESLLGLVEDILDISTIEAGTLRIENKPFNIFMLITQLCDQMANLAGEKGISLMAMVPSSIPEIIIGDKLRLGQVLSNLIGNAVKFTETGTVLIKVGLGYDHLKTDNQLLFIFEVIDSGIGIYEDKKEEIFEVFTQADISMTRKYGGAGLGLSIAKHLVELMGGSIRVRDNSPHGSIFYFSIPLAIAENNKSLFEEVPSDLTNKKILLCSENSALLAIYQQYLAEFSFNYVATTQVEKAVDILHRNNNEQSKQKFDLIIIECHSLRTDGLQISKKFYGLFGLPLIMITANSSEERKWSEKQLEGISGVLLKPFNQFDLINKIAAIYNQPEIKSIYTSLSWSPDKLAIRTIQGASVLVVEDLDINQKLIKEMLDNWKLTTHLAGNGEEAIKLLHQHHIDIILMDIQMPVMDGYETTKIIRASNEYADIPIVALTAHALTEDRDKIFAAGMNDYITKPINIDKLFVILHNSLKSCHISMETEEIDDEEQEKFPVLDFLLGLKNAMGNKPLYLTLLNELKKRLDSEVPQLIAHLSKRETEQAIEIVHNLKGIAGNLGATELYQVTKKLYEALQGCASNEYMPIFIQFLQVVKYLKAELDELINEKN